MLIAQETGPQNAPEVCPRDAAENRPVTAWPAQSHSFRGFTQALFKQRLVLGVNGGAVSPTQTHLC